MPNDQQRFPVGRRKEILRVGCEGGDGGSNYLKFNRGATPWNMQKRPMKERGESACGHADPGQGTKGINSGKKIKRVGDNLAQNNGRNGLINARGTVKPLRGGKIAKRRQGAEKAAID